MGRWDGCLGLGLGSGVGRCRGRGRGGRLGRAGGWWLVGVEGCLVGRRWDDVEMSGREGRGRGRG